MSENLFIVEGGFNPFSEVLDGFENILMFEGGIDNLV